MHPYRDLSNSSSEADLELAPNGTLDDCVVLGVLFVTGLVLLGAALCGEPSPIAAVFGVLLVACSLWSFVRDVMARKPPA